jgi:hypothetical protein
MSNDELTYWIGRLRIFSKALKRISVDPQMPLPQSARDIAGEVLLSGKDAFLLDVDRTSENIARLREVAHMFSRTLGYIASIPDVTSKPDAAHAIQVLHTYTLLPVCLSWS